MAKKTFRIKLYYPHDLDLISLMLTHEMNFTKAVYCALTAFCKGEVFALKIPPLRNTVLPKKRQYNKDLNLYTEKDLDAIELLMKIAPGYRNNFLKNLLRLYIMHPATESFLQYQEEMPLFDDYFSIFRNGKKVADAATLKNKSKLSNKKKKTEYLKSTKQDSEKQSRIPHETIPKEIGKNIQLIPNNTDEIITDTVTTEESENLTDLFAALLG